MRVPRSWLREVVDVDLACDELVDVMSTHGLEVQEVRRPGAGAAGVTVARVLARRPHPGATKLGLVTVTDGATETEVVCGAWNFDVGDVVAHAVVGASLPGGMTVEARAIRGVMSHGMLCSARELQAGDDHTGIIVLPGDAELGSDVHDLLPLGEPVLDVAIPADRGDLLSILGIARDLAAILDTGYRLPDAPATAPAGPVPITIEAPEGCRQFVAGSVGDVTLAPSPWWLRFRLVQCGIRPIGNVVDVTNYVMLELGQPLHAFDLDALGGPELVVRWARPGEQLTTLDGQTRSLRHDDLVILDAARPISLAGVMGGAETEVGPTTRRVVFEGATWDPATIRRTSRRLGLVSEASLRFERRVDPEAPAPAVARAVALLGELTGSASDLGGNVAGGPGDRDGAVTVDAHRTAAFLGLLDLDGDTQARLLGRSGCAVTSGGDGQLRVAPPSWRGDLQRPADIAEEIARLHGYERIPSRLPAIAQPGRRTPSQRAEREIHAAVLAGGFHEAVTRPFVGDGAIAGVVPTDGRLQLTNPLAKDASGLRSSLLEGLLAAVRRNVGQGRPGVALFEYGRVFRPSGDALEEVLKGFGDAWRWRAPDGRDLPTQPRALGLAAQGVRTGRRWLGDAAWGVFDLLAVLDEVVARVRPADDPDWRLTREPASRPGLHPGRTASLRLKGAEVGVVGQLHPAEIQRRDLVEPVVVAELLVEPLLEHLVLAGPEAVQARPLPRHPAVTVDVALVAAEEVAYADLEAAVRAGAGELLDQLWWFDEYRGEQVGAGNRSIAIRLRLQSPDRQLSDTDADAVLARVRHAAEAIGASLRS